MKRFIKIVAVCVAVVLVCASFTACGEKKAEPVVTVGSQLAAPAAGEEIAVMHTTMGDIYLRFFPKAAPKAVENFVTHAKNGYYDDLTFHRVINDFMIQSGDPKGNSTGGKSIWGKAFEDEFHADLHNLRGALSMANSGANTNGSQFFIVQAKTVDASLVEQMKALPDMFPEAVVQNYEAVGGTPHLDYRHSVFGQVFKGMDVVDAIAAVETDANNKPLQAVKIISIEFKEYTE